jgi:hypothetical protein
MVAIFPLQAGRLGVHTSGLHVAVGPSQYWLALQVWITLDASPLALHLRTTPAWQYCFPASQTTGAHVAAMQT